MGKSIELLTNQGKNCREDVIATAVQFLGHDYRLLFSDAWGFDMLPRRGEDTLGDRILVDWGDIYEMSAKFCGVRIEHIDFDTAEEAHSAIVKQIQSDGIAGFLIDAHWCPWMDFFQMEGVHVMGHTVLSYDVLKKNELLCLDCLPAHYGVKIPYEYFLKGSTGKTIQFIKDESECKEVSSKEIIKNALHKVYHKGAYGNTFEAIRAFSKEFPNIVFEDECQGYGKNDFWNSKLFIKILNLANGRKQVGRVLKELAERENNEAIGTIGDQLIYIGGKWLGIRGCLIKARLAGLNQVWLKRIIGSLEEIANYEENIASQLEEIIQSDGNVKDNKQISLEENAFVNKQILAEKVIKVELDGLFNSKGFDDIVSLESDADITGTGDYLLLENLSENTCIEADGLIYKLSVGHEKKFDNISCGSQVLPLKIENPSMIGFLACAEWGDFYDKMEVLYEDGSIQELYFQLDDWCVRPKEENTFYINVKSVSTSNGELSVDSEPRYICAITRRLKCGNTVKKIRFPNCPNIHIFALSAY